MTAKKRYRVAAMLLILANLCFLLPVPVASAAHVSVYDRDSLKEELKKDGNRVIELMESVTIRSTLKVCGNKVLTGPGEIRRAIANESAFGGNLLRVAGGSLTLKNITINGRGDAGVLKGKLYGWLIQVDSGQLTIGSGAVLKNNKNSSRLSDGGGAVRVTSGATCVMNGGTISGNECITGGAGIRIDSGGACVVKSGSITGNRVVGKSATEGFDGRGGGIYNKGTLALYGGSIGSNSVKGYYRGGATYGGVGGGIANAGNLLLQGGSVTGNHGRKGSDVGLIRGHSAINGTARVSECWMKSGQLLHVGNSYKSGTRIRLIPENIKEGVRLADGLSGKTWKKQFSYPSSIKEKGLKVSLKNGTLVIKKKVIKKIKPSASPQAGSSGGGSSGGGASGGSGYVPNTPRPHPSYIPVRTADPMAEIILASRAPAHPTFSPTPSPMPTVAPTSSHRHISTYRPYATRVPTQAPSPARPIRTLPNYLLFPQTAKSVRSVETNIPIEWSFSSKDIRVIKREIKTGDDRVQGVAFLRRIRGNIVEKGEIKNG